MVRGPSHSPLIWAIESSHTIANCSPAFALPHAAPSDLNMSGTSIGEVTSLTKISNPSSLRVR